MTANGSRVPFESDKNVQNWIEVRVDQWLRALTTDYSFKPSVLEAETGGSLSSRPVWSLRLHKEIWS